MKSYKTPEIKNICLLGHQGSGKTTLVESFLLQSKAIEKKGEVEKKNTVSDYLVEEQNKLASLSMSIIPVEWKNTKINILDVPGSDEFQGDLFQSLQVVKGAIIVIDGSKGVEVGTERVIKETRKRHIPTIIFVNKMDKENIKPKVLVESIKTSLGKSVVEFAYPLGHDESFDGYIDVLTATAHVYDKNGTHKIEELYPDKKEIVEEIKTKLVELAVETDEKLMELYFAGEEITKEQLGAGLKQGIIDGNIVPLFVGSALKDICIDTLLDSVLNYFPAPNELSPIKATTNKDEVITRGTDDKNPFAGYVFKTIVDPFLGTLSFVKIISGTLTVGQEVILGNKGDSKKIMNLFGLRGKTQLDIDTFHAGDICALSKLEGVETSDTLADKSSVIIFEKAFRPTPVIYVAVRPKNKNDEDKISGALQRLNIEDPTFEVVRNKETAQLLIGGSGMNHLGYIFDRMKTMFKVEVDNEPQKIVYRETFKKKVDSAEGKHKKQSGGAGQFGHVFIRFEPSITEGYPNNLWFSEEVFGGAVPRNYFPAVEKGLIETFEHGPLAGFPVINVKAVLIDGSYHPVDSNELSFKLAASLAFKKACETSSPTILEPICKVLVTVKDQYVGDVMGDMNKRRGKVLGMSQNEGFQIVDCECPEAEIVSYAIDLKAMTQGSGSFTREFDRYEEVPSFIIPKIVEQYSKKD
ncbi:MAG: elongation factor G [Acholeplasmatales bacterium]|jgi:elongation factor G|nr:elongation factor G [Acholeplasmatales bacterium]